MANPDSFQPFPVDYRRVMHETSSSLITLWKVILEILSKGGLSQISAGSIKAIDKIIVVS